MFRLNRSTNRWIKQISLLIILGCVLIGTGSWLFANSSWLSEEGHFKEQPIAFSHELHINQVGLQCIFCHTQVDKDSSAGMPSMETCYGCHQEILNNTEFLKPVRDSYLEKKSMPWNRVNRVADHVYFHHAAHVKAGVSCQSCHGDVERMPLVAKEEPLNMQWCLNCHKKQDYPLNQKLQGCYTCHR